MKNKKNYLPGFSLIELLVVIAVLGVLATIAFIFVNPQAQILKAQVATTQTALNQMKTEIEGIRVVRNQTLLQITGNGCSECACRCADATTNAACINAVTATWARVSTKPLPKDPWGNILMYDENEGEQGPNDCRAETLRSPGPDHILGDYGCPANGNDDISLNVPAFFCQ